MVDDDSRAGGEDIVADGSSGGKPAASFSPRSDGETSGYLPSGVASVNSAADAVEGTGTKWSRSASFWDRSLNMGKLKIALSCIGLLMDEAW